jgi:putative spermidine/putrescine transport system permease protein
VESKALDHPMAAERQSWTASDVFRWAALILLSIWLVGPFIPMLIWSFSFRWTFPDLLPETWSLRAWEYVGTRSSQVVPAIFDSFLIALPVTLLSAIIAIPAGRALGLHRFPGKRFVEFLILAPNIIPGLTVALGIQIVFIHYGLANTIVGVILVHLVSSMSYAVLVMAGVFANYNPEAEEVSRTLGASRLQTFRYVTLPSIFPGLVVASLFAFLISWDQYIATIIIAGGFVKTLSILVVAAAGGGERAISGALSIVFVAPAVVFLIIASRYLTGEGASLGGFDRR